MRNHHAQDYHAGSRCPRFTFFLATQSMSFEKERELALKSFELGVVAMTTGYTLEAYDYFAEACEKWNNINKDGYKEIRETYISDYFNAAIALFQMTRIKHKEEDWDAANQCLNVACQMLFAYMDEFGNSSEELDDDSDKARLMNIMKQTIELKTLCPESQQQQPQQPQSFAQPLPAGDNFSLDSYKNDEDETSVTATVGQLQQEKENLKRKRKEDDKTLQQSPGKRSRNS